MIAGLLLAVPLLQELPFETLGSAFLEEVDARAPAPSSARLPEEALFLERLAGMHHKLSLGGVELWVPRVACSAGGSFGKGLDPRDARPWARELIELERLWFEHLDLEGDALAANEAALARIARFVESLGTNDVPAPDGGLDAALLEIVRPFPHPAVARPPVLIVAPSRAHMVALFGAAGLAVPAQRDRLWVDGLSRFAFSWLFWEVLVVPLETAVDADTGTLISSRHEDQTILETIVHRSSHMLSERVIPQAPQWFLEGLALDDTIRVTGDDDSLCTGFSQRERIYGAVTDLEWLDANKSPYREGAASRWFDKELKPDKEGWFTIYDLDTGRSGLQLQGPFLGAGARTPATVVSGPKGLQRGYSEFFRAYSAAFVHWLELQRVGGRSVRHWLIEFVRDPERREMVSDEELAPVALRMITMKTLGESDDPERDLEAAFIVWLREGR
jgi:hypothetical protein